MHAREEVYTDQAINDIKMEMTLRKVFKMYRDCRKELLDTVVDRMMASNGYSTQPNSPGWVDKLGKYSAQYLDAERYVEFIDSLMARLDKRSYVIIDALYCSDEPPTKEYLFTKILNLSKKHYYRIEPQAKRKMYDLLAKNYEKLKI